LVGSTPTSFNNIPPLLRHKEENVSVTLDPPLHGFTPQDAAHGTLYVLESVLVFMSTTGHGFQIGYPAITLHAVSRAESGPSIYCQLDEQAGVTNSLDDDAVIADMRELCIVPQTPSSLEPIFEALSVCASLHPDDATSSDGDMDNAFIDAGAGFETFTGDEEQEFSQVGRAALTHLESVIYDPYDLTQENGQNGGLNGNG